MTLLGIWSIAISDHFSTEFDSYKAKYAENNKMKESTLPKQSRHESLKEKHKASRHRRTLSSSYDELSVELLHLGMEQRPQSWTEKIPNSPSGSQGLFDGYVSR